MHSSTQLTVPEGYEFVLAVALAAGFLVSYQGILVSQARKAAGIEYPTAYATVEQCKADFKAQVFNCTVRSHANTLETLPFFLFTLLFAGLQFPNLALFFGVVQVIGRYFYTVGYNTGFPENRNTGIIHVAGLAGVQILSCISVFNIFLARFV